MGRIKQARALVNLWQAVRRALDGKKTNIVGVIWGLLPFLFDAMRAFGYGEWVPPQEATDYVYHLLQAAGILAGRAAIAKAGRDQA